MGYRSQVCIALTDDATRLLKAIEQHLPENHEAKSLLKDAEGSYPDEITPDDDCFSKLFWDYIKWYDEFECISFMESFLDYIPEEDYKFARLGENYEDVDERGEFYESDIQIHRSIEW